MTSNCMTCKQCVNHDMCQERAHQDAAQAGVAERDILAESIDNKAACKWFRDKDVASIKRGEWLGKMINGNEVGTYDGIITIVKESYDECTAKRIIITTQGTHDDKFISLNECLQIIGYNDGDVVTVIIDDAFRGNIYQYGNYIKKEWCEHGSTKGYA